MMLMKEWFRKEKVRINNMPTREWFEGTNYKMSYEEYKKCYCSECKRKNCLHRDAYRRMPEADGGLGLCPNLKGDD